MKTFWLAAAAVLVPVPAFAAAAPIPTSSSRHETAALVGLQWNFGASAPELVVGVRSTTTRPSGAVSGVKFDVAIPLNDNWQKPNVRVLGIAGRRNLLGEAGLGYSFSASSVVIGAGAQAPFVNGGVNYAPGSSLMPYFGLNSFNRPKAARKVDDPG